MKFLYKLFSIFLFFVILIFISQIAKDLSKNFTKSETSEIFEKSEKSRKSRKSVKETEILVRNSEDIIVQKPGFVFEDIGEVPTGDSEESGSENGSVDDPVDKPNNHEETIVEQKLFDEETGVRLLTETEMEAIENRNSSHHFLIHF